MPIYASIYGPARSTSSYYCYLPGDVTWFSPRETLFRHGNDVTRRRRHAAKNGVGAVPVRRRDLDLERPLVQTSSRVDGSGSRGGSLIVGDGPAAVYSGDQSSFRRVTRRVQDKKYTIQFKIRFSISDQPLGSNIRL